MNIDICQSKEQPARFSIWLVGTSFVLLQFFLQLSSGVVMGAIMQEQHLSALTAGLLSSSFYIIYTCLQIPVGILCDRNNPRPLLVASALILSLGCLLFAASYSLLGLFLGRTLIGIGSSFAFVGLTHLLRHYFPPERFAFMVGITETLSFIVTVCGIIGMGEMIQRWGWRDFINTAALIGAIIACLCWRYIPNETEKNNTKEHYGKQLILVLSNNLLWVNGLFISLTFAVVTVFGALWAIPFLQVKLHCTLRHASILNAFFFLGTGLSCPLFGILSQSFQKRKPLILASCIITALLLLMALYIPTENKIVMGGMLFMIGLCCGAYILAYPIANELAPARALSTSTGFTNTLAIVTTPLLQPFIGYLLECSNSTGHYTIADYQFALLILPICFFIACILVCFLPEKGHPN